MTLSLHFSTQTRTMPGIPIERLYPGMELTAVLTGRLCNYSHYAAIEHYIRLYNQRKREPLTQVECWSGQEFKSRIQIRLGQLVRLSEWTSLDPDPSIGKPLIASAPSVDWNRVIQDEFWNRSPRPSLLDRCIGKSGEELYRAFRAPGLKEWMEKYKKI